MCFRLYSVVGQIHYLPIYYYKEHSFTCQELSRKRKDGVGFHRHHNINYPILLAVLTFFHIFIKSIQKIFISSVIISESSSGCNYTYSTNTYSTFEFAFMLYSKNMALSILYKTYKISF